MRAHFRLIAVTAVLALAGVLTACDQSQNKNGSSVEELVVVSYGGAWQDAQRKAFFEPFEKKFHVRIREETWSGDFGKLKAMVQSGNVTWDAVDVEAYMVPRGAAQNLYEKIDYSLVPKAELFPAAIHEYGVATCFWSTILAYNTNAFKGGSHPSGWKDFWNVVKFPGARALRKDPVANLEIALLAAGVPKDNLYPLDVDAAFRSLDRIKPQVRVWWEAGEQPAQLLGSGEVAASTGWNGRIYNAANAGKPEAIDWTDGIISSDWWVIPRGSKHRDLAEEFIAYASSAGPQAAMPTYIPYGPVNKKSIAIVPKQILQNLPTAPANVAKQVFMNNAWWNDHQAEVLERWNRWLLQ